MVSCGFALYSIIRVYPTLYCRPCEAFTSDNDAMIELGGEIPSGGFTEIEKEITEFSLLR